MSVQTNIKYNIYDNIKYYSNIILILDEEIQFYKSAFEKYKCEKCSKISPILMLRDFNKKQVETQMLLLQLIQLKLYLRKLRELAVSKFKSYKYFEIFNKKN